MPANKNIVQISHAKVGEFFGDSKIFCAIDATLGGGGDALFAASLLSDDGKVFGFDVQPEAVARTSQLFAQNAISDKGEFFCRGHEFMLDCIPQKFFGKVACIFFNLGWLPNSDKTCITKPATTLAALNASLRILDKSRGIISVASYRGHSGGMDEYKVVRDFFAANFGVDFETFGDENNLRAPILFIAKFVDKL